MSSLTIYNSDMGQWCQSAKPKSTSDVRLEINEDVGLILGSRSVSCSSFTDKSGKKHAKTSSQYEVVCRPIPWSHDRKLASPDESDMSLEGG